MKNIIDKFDVQYLCGCRHEIGRNVVGVWVPTGKETNCEAHR